METKIYTSILQIPPAEWNALIEKNNIISTWEHLAAIEESGINDCVYRYVVLQEAGRAVGCACFYYISFDLDIFNRGAAKKIIEFIRKHFYQRFFRMRVIECGTPTALGNTLNWLPGADSAKILEGVVSAMRDFAREMKVNILIFRDFVISELPTFDALKKLAFRRVGILPNTSMVNRWKDFGEYEMDLKRHNRYIVRRYSRTLKEQGVSVRVLSDYAHLAPELHRLWRECYDHAREYQREVLTQAYFINLSRRMGDGSRVILFEKEGQPIGLLIGIRNGELFQGLFAGMDYRYVKDCFLLFNIYLETIRLGIDLGVKVIENGLTTIGEKMNFGFQPVPMFAYMRHLSPVVNPVISRLFSLFSESTRFENKRIFNRRYAERVFGNCKVSLSSGGKEFSGQLEDLSPSGARITCDPGFRGKKAMLRFRFENSVNDFEVNASVRWTKAEGGSQQVGLKFRVIEPEKLNEIYELISLIPSGEKEE